MSDLQIFDCEQGTPEWFAARLGIPTASKFATVMAQGRAKGTPSVTRRDYMLDLIGEQMTGQCAESYSNSHMQRGHEMEPDARNLYAMIRDVEPSVVGFMRRGDVGASPDSLVGDDGLLEIKTRLPRLQLGLILSGGLPPEHKAQVYGQLWVSGREWCDFLTYWPGLPVHIVRVNRDEEYIATIAAAVDAFNSEMADLAEQIKRIAA